MPFDAIYRSKIGNIVRNTPLRRMETRLNRFWDRDLRRRRIAA